MRNKCGAMFSNQPVQRLLLQIDHECDIAGDIGCNGWHNKEPAPSVMMFSVKKT